MLETALWVEAYSIQCLVCCIQSLLFVNFIGFQSWPEYVVQCLVTCV